MNAAWPPEALPDGGLLDNRTPWRAQALPFFDDDAREGRLVVVKLQYRLAAGRPLEAMEADPLRHDDEAEGDGGGDGGAGPGAPLRRPADVMAPQSATNVIVLGSVEAAGGEVAAFEPWIGIGATVFPLRVHGPREWRARGWATRLASLFIARRFKCVRTGRVRRLALSWRHAYGGAGWPGNPAGTGHPAGPAKADLHGLALPRIDDPRAPLRRWDEAPAAPHLPGAVHPRWLPRRALGGTQDGQWQATRAPALPADARPGWHDTAHPALQFRPRLQGGEPVRLEGFAQLLPAVDFVLPHHRFTAHGWRPGSLASCPVPLDTVLIEADRQQLTLLYRAFVPRWTQGLELRRLVLDDAASPAAPPAGPPA
ncbi:DUF2169 domain-containing protein [Aquincola sp. MAHUQ-54]|uniref:DUF2169 domain-containing protein n=1 Tax=Aquincola agrisoli TaxID=3119538 RepID=A0AAW9Q945_9BURK